MSARKSIITRASARKSVQPRVKVWLELRGEYVFGQGLVRMLEAVRKTGSIKEAARKLGKSYRYVWGRIKQAEEAIGESLVESQVGGTGSHRSDLTPRAVELLEAFQALRQRVTDVLEKEFTLHFGGKKK
jgi:molybdate transport system regulatory protein